VCNEEGLVATNALEGLLFDRYDLQTTDNGKTASLPSISTFGLAGFSGAKLWQIKVQGFGATAGDAEGNGAS
jgi:hypothetical protein